MITETSAKAFAVVRIHARSIMPATYWYVWPIEGFVALTAFLNCHCIRKCCHRSLVDHVYEVYRRSLRRSCCFLPLPTQTLSGGSQIVYFDIKTSQPSSKWLPILYLLALFQLLGSIQERYEPKFCMKTLHLTMYTEVQNASVPHVSHDSSLLCSDPVHSSSSP